MSQATDHRVEIHGVRFDDVDQSAVVTRIVAGLADGRGGWVVTPNVDFVRRASADPELARLIDRATLSVLDGAPVQWAGRIAGRPPVQRTQGSSLADPLAAEAQARGIPILLLGGRPGAAQEAADRLRTQYPGLVVNHCCPPLGFEQDPEEWGAVISSIRAVDGGIVLVGLGFPKQERLNLAMSTQFPSTWFLGVGGTIDFLGGCVPRAPRWIQDIGFEWAFRLLVEPRRLARRYLVDGLPFAARLLAWALHQRLTTRGRTAITAAPVAVPAIAGQVQRIDLDRRVVEVTAGDDAVVELSVAEFLAGAEEAGRPEPAEQVIDLRDGVLHGAPTVTDVIDLRDGLAADGSVAAASVPLPRAGAPDLAAVSAGRRAESDESVDQHDVRPPLAATAHEKDAR